MSQHSIDILRGSLENKSSTSKKSKTSVPKYLEPFVKADVLDSELKFTPFGLSLLEHGKLRLILSTWGDN